MKSLITMLVCAFVLTACAVQKTWVATGGSRADGVVSLAYEYGAFEAPETSAAQGETEAAARCGVWGYSGAVPFGGDVVTCTMPDLFGGCNRWRVSRDYQCTGPGA